MKKQYIKPELEMVKYSLADVLDASSSEPEVTVPDVGGESGLESEPGWPE